MAKPKAPRAPAFAPAESFFFNINFLIYNKYNILFVFLFLPLNPIKPPVIPPA